VEGAVTQEFRGSYKHDTKAGADKKDDPAQFPKQGFEALMADKHDIIAGSLKTKIRGTASKVLPDTVNAELHRQLTEPGSVNK